MGIFANVVCSTIHSTSSNFILMRPLESIQATTRYQSLVEFSSVYGIGPTNARRLYDLGLRTIKHVEQYYEADEGELDNGLEGIEDGTETRRLDMSIKVALRLRQHLMEK